MQSLSRRASIGLAAVCLVFVALVVAASLAGIAGTNSATRAGNAIAGNELATSTATAQLARDMDAVYATGEAELQSSRLATRLADSTSLYSTLIPLVNTKLEDLERLHADDPLNQANDIRLFVRQWDSVQDLLSPSAALGGARTTTPAELTRAYEPLGTHLDRLILQEKADAAKDQAAASSSSDTTTGLLIGAMALGLLLALSFIWIGARRIHRVIEPQREQNDFADTLQIADDEEEAHLLLQRHLERAVSGAGAVVLNRNNSADRLEAVTPVPEASPLRESLRGAEPRSCLAVRSGRAHYEGRARPGLLSCAICGNSPGRSTCVPLTVGGEVIGSVLLNRSSELSELEEQRVRESVSQAAPVLANLRNLAVAEIRAATDGLTGLPNKRAVTDTLKRLFAQAARTHSTFSLVLLDLDHFKLINDRLGHPVGDQVLANVGSILQGSLRASDFAGRNGGEEFAILLPETSIAGALEIAERVRHSIADITLPGVDVSVTASLGIAGYPDHAGTLERLERLADAALYLAKRQGRNRTELADAANGPPGSDELEVQEFARLASEDGHLSAIHAHPRNTGSTESDPASFEHSSRAAEQAS